MEKIIEIKNLQKNFGKLEVLKGVDLDIHKGEVELGNGLDTKFILFSRSPSNLEIP